MAKLQSDNLTLEIIFKNFKDQWVIYDIKFYWKNDIIVNDGILKRSGDWWNKRNYGTFLVDDYEKDHLIETILKVLETNKPEYWEPLEPDAKIAIYPEMFFPFLEPHWILVEEEKDRKGKEEDRKNKIKEEYEPRNLGNQVDLFTVITFIDSYNFADSDSYSGEGISLHLIVTRKDLEKFVAELEVEYSDLRNKIKRNYGSE